MANASPGDNLDYASTEDPVETARFTVAFTAVKVAYWSVLLIAALAYGFFRRRSVSKAWTLYRLLLGTLFMTFLEVVVYLVYLLVYRAGHVSVSERIWLVCIFFKNAASASFLGVLLVLASGFCITRSDFGIHKDKVIGVPTVVLCTGLISDYVFWELQSSMNGDQYALSDMNQLEEAVWFVGSIVNLVALVLAWVYTFDILQAEIQALDSAHQALQAPAAASAATVNGHAANGGHNDPLVPQRSHDSSSSANVSLLPVSQNASHSPGGADEEMGGLSPEKQRETETVADRVQFTAKRTLLGRFAIGVAAYLIGNILVILMPVMINEVVQNVIKALQFLINFSFLAALLWIFRPERENPYLMVGIDEGDADERGVGSLATEVAMTETHTRDQGLDFYDDEEGTLCVGSGSGQNGGGTSAIAKAPLQFGSAFSATGSGGGSRASGSKAAGNGGSLLHQLQQQLPARPASGQAAAPGGQGRGGTESNGMSGRSNGNQLAVAPPSGAGAGAAGQTYRVPPPQSGGAGLHVSTQAPRGALPNSNFSLDDDEATDAGEVDAADLAFKRAMARAQQQPRVNSA